VQGWWLLVFAAGAVILPYVAVVIANVSGPTRNPEVLRPGGLVPVTPPSPTTPPDDRGAASGADDSAASAEDRERGAA
jgi:hypothetical protein